MENFAFAITVSLILHFFKGSGSSAILTHRQYVIASQRFVSLSCAFAPSSGPSYTSGQHIKYTHAKGLEGKIGAH